MRYEGENVWNVKYRKIGEDMCGYDGVDAHIVVRLQNPEDDASATYKWEVTASGNDDDGGIVACFTTGETPAVIGNMQPYTSNPEYCVYSGRFVVDMYKGDGKIDYCYMSFDDGEMEFDTSRD